MLEIWDVILTVNNYSEVDLHIAWLDGYLKGLAVQESAACYTLNVLKLKLPGNPIKEYLDFINDYDDEVDNLASSILSLSEKRAVVSFEQSIKSHVVRILTDSRSESVDGVMHQVLDTVDAVLGGGAAVSAFSCEARMMSCMGEYIFIQMNESEYLIIGFLYKSKDKA